ncbi:MAG: tRNA 2-thiouridine(34) synthase MnmA [Alphaproteobacteria bacterium]|nr:tRNA 2-thiouridine(34) synthase MnmA [Alphaproteobacteria bacterium]
MAALDLAIAKPAAATRVVVAMSGGVDSSVVAGLVREAGYDTVGITLQLYDQGAAARRPGACCAGQDIADARRVAERLGIPHYVLDYEERFRRAVIDDFADSYLAGETPIPCVRCNQTVKFRDLVAVARDLGADALATGHYARRIAGPAGPELHRAVDPSRDQSYFLFATTPEQLAFLRFPLGGMAKDATRAEARRFGLPVAGKRDSQDICFVPSGGYAAVVERLRPGAAEPGDIVHVDGTVLGRHPGIIHFTVGQRRGLGIGGRGADADPLFVVRLDAAARRVVVGPHAALGVARVMLRDAHWLVAPPADPLPVAVKLRSAQPPVPALARATGGGAIALDLATPQAGVAPGQAGVLYQGDRVLAGGWIAGTQGAADAARGSRFS